ncbi:probable cytochrome P450 28a5 [Phlebotomus argentipes]|uniref:probable cytochrome P450 28a5 n=1 Tax=Phlebotomus argentipes TaxID=94469 RepID=UPI0028937A7F|nr:probable cytochrome P450 28a5 [Phlebotomus argentipes]
MIQFILTSVCALLIAGYFYISWNYDHWKKRNIPGPKARFLLGNLPSVVTQKRNITYDMDDLYREFKDRYGLIGYYNTRSPALMVLQPDLARDMLIKNFKHFADNEFADLADKNVDPILSRNPFMLKGEEWKEKRAEITPAFTTSRIKTMYPIIEDVCANMKKYLEEEFEKETMDGIDAKELSAMYTTDVVSSCIFGVDAGSFTGGDATIRKMGKGLFDPTWQMMVYFFMMEIIPFLTKFYKMPMVPKHVEKFFVKIMKDAIALRRKTDVNRFDYLHYLLELQEKKNLNELDMVAHAVTFFLDGFETSSIAMAFTLYELGKCKNVQEKLRQEIRETIAKHGKITHEVVSEMPYLDQVLNESLRLYPPATMLGKICTEKITIKVKEGEYRYIEEGDDVTFPVYSFHRDPEFYENPDEFIPERFDPENGGVKAFRDKGVFVPFGDGPRICLGQRFAQAQIKAALVSLLDNFEVEVNPKTKEPIIFDPKQFLTYAIGGLWLNFKRI